MLSARSYRALPVLASLLALSALSCSGDGRTPVYPVKGQVHYKGKPAASAMVVFHKVGEDDKRAIKPFATAGPDGAFQLSYYNANDGAPEGEYVVTIVWPTPPPANSPDLEAGPDRLKGRYADPAKSKWRMRVEKKENVLEPLRIE